MQATPTPIFFDVFCTLLIITFNLVSPIISLAGELDGKGIVCPRKSNKKTYGFYFENGIVNMFYFKGGASKLNLVTLVLKLYKTDERSISWEGVSGFYSLDKKSLVLCFEYEPNQYCKVAGDYNKFLEMMDPKLNTKENKI